MLNPLSLELNVERKIELNGLLSKAEVLIVKNKERRTYAGNLKVEIEVSSFRKEQGERTVGLKKLDGVSKEKHDRQVNQINDNSLPKLKVQSIKLDQEVQITFVKQKQIN